MGFRQDIWRVEGLGILALLLVAIVVGVFSALWLLVSVDNGTDWEWLAAGIIVFLFAAQIGLLPVVLLGAPLYTLHLNNRYLKLWHLYVVASILGLALVFADKIFGWWPLFAALLTVLVIDVLAKRAGLKNGEDAA